MLRAPSQAPPAFSIVVALYDEAANVAPLCAEIAEVLGGRNDFELILVDDGSTDGTRAEIEKVQAAGILSLHGVRHRSNVGQSAALRTGGEAARGEWIVTMDGDCQNDPADVDTLFGALAEHASTPRLDMVCGYRKIRRDTWLRRVSSRVANAVRSRLLADDTPDTGCGIKLIRRETFLSLPVFANMHRFLPALVQRSGGQVVSVAVNHRPRLRGQAKYGLHNRLWAGIADLIGVMWLMRRPLIRDIEGKD